MLKQMICCLIMAVLLSFMFSHITHADVYTVATTEIIGISTMTTQEKQTWVNIVKNQGIPVFIVRIWTAGGEWQSGEKTGLIDDLAEMVEIANNAGINVAVDFHTTWVTWDNYFDDNAENHDTNRAQYIRYIKNSIGNMSNINIYAYQVYNEPQAQTPSESENQFLLDVVQAAKNVTNKPVSIRWMGRYSPSCGYYSENINLACDYICINTYWDPRDPNTPVWGCLEQHILAERNWAHNHGKQFWITEFGRHNDNETEQADYVKAFVQWSINHDIDLISCWLSYPEGTNEYNIFNGYIPRPAFYELVSEEESEPTPVPSPTSYHLNGRSSSGWESTLEIVNGFMPIIMCLVALQGILIFVKKVGSQ